MSCGSVINKGAAHLLGIKFAVLLEGSAILTQDSWAFLPVQENDDGSRNSKFLLNASRAYVQRNCPVWCVKATRLRFQIIQLVILNFHPPYLKSVFLLIGSFSPTQVHRTCDPVLTDVILFLNTRASGDRSGPRKLPCWKVPYQYIVLVQGC